MKNIAELKNKYIRVKETFEELKTAKNQAIEEINARFSQELTFVAKQIEDTKAELTAQALELYDGENKQISDGISIRVNKKYSYVEDEAVEWALNHNMPNLLKINAAKFKKQATISEIDFVEIVDVPVVVIKQ